MLLKDAPTKTSSFYTGAECELLPSPFYALHRLCPFALRLRAGRLLLLWLVCFEKNTALSRGWCTPLARGSAVCGAKRIAQHANPGLLSWPLRLSAFSQNAIKRNQDKGPDDEPAPQSERTDGAAALPAPRDQSDDSEGSDTDDGETGSAVPRPNDEHTAISTSTLATEDGPSHAPVRNEDGGELVAPPPLFDAHSYIKQYGAASARWHASLASGLRAAYGRATQQKGPAPP